MRKFLTSLIILTLTATGVSAQQVLKENVPIVKSEYSESSKEFLQNLANRIRRNGYRTAADNLERIVKGGSGSGFIYVDPTTQKTYVITNRHVVSQASSASLEFVHTDEEIKLEDCKLIAVDEVLDLAIIELPEECEYELGEGFSILNETKEEGIDVFTAGFPGLIGEPTWQLGKGIISNSSVQNKIFRGTENFGAIQHTAPIDPGNSGGPLLVKNGDSYSVIGVNTWGVSNRDNTYFAISSKAVLSFLEKYLNKRYDSEADLERRAKELLATLGDNYEDAVPYVSDEYVATMSTTNFFEIIINIPDSVETKMASYFRGNDPIDGVRLGISYFLYKQQQKDEVSFVRIEPTDSIGEKKVIMLTKEKEFETIWTYHLGEWKLKDYTKLDFKNLEDNGISENYLPDRTIKLGYEIASNADGLTQNSFVLEAVGHHSTYFFSGLQIRQGKIDVSRRETDFVTQEERTVYEPEGMFHIGYLLGGQLPIKMNNIYLIPNAKGVVAWGIGEDIMSVPLTAELGVDVAYKIAQGTSLLLGVSYRNSRFITSVDDKFADYKAFNGFQFHIGISY